MRIGKNIAEFQNAGFDPRGSMLEPFTEIFIEAAQPRTAHASVHAVKGARSGWIDKLSAGLGH